MKIGDYDLGATFIDKQNRNIIVLNDRLLTDTKDQKSNIDPFESVLREELVHVGDVNISFSESEEFDKAFAKEYLSKDETIQTLLSYGNVYNFISLNDEFINKKRITQYKTRMEDEYHFDENEVKNFLKREYLANLFGIEDALNHFGSDKPLQLPAQEDVEIYNKIADVVTEYHNPEEMLSSITPLSYEQLSSFKTKLKLGIDIRGSKSLGL